MQLARLAPLFNGAPSTPPHVFEGRGIFRSNENRTIELNFPKNTEAAPSECQNFDEPLWRCVYSCGIVISFHAMVLHGVVLVSSCLFVVFYFCFVCFVW